MLHNISHNALQPVTKLGLASVREIWRNRAFTLVLVDNPSIHPLEPYSLQSVGAASAVSLAIGHNPGRIATPTQDTSKLALILPTSEG